MKCKLSEICQYRIGKVEVSTLTKNTYISTENMLPNRGGVTTASTLPTISQTQLFRRGDILVSNIRPYFKKIWQATFDGGCSNDVLVFSAKDNNISDFLYYVLADDAFFDYSMAISKGTKMPRGDKTAIMNFQVPHYAPSAQMRIARILRSLDDKIELNNRINENLEQQAFALFDSCFPNVSAGVKTIGDYIAPKRGKNLLTKDAIGGNVPVVAGGLEPSAYHNVANTSSPVLTISASGANSGFVRLWGVPIWSSDSSFIDSQMTPYVYFWYVMLKRRQKEIYDSQTGSAQPHIYPQHIAAMPVIELQDDDILKYNNQISSFFSMIAVNKEENKRLVEMRNSLLPRLMSGELDVSEMAL